MAFKVNSATTKVDFIDTYSSYLGDEFYISNISRRPWFLKMPKNVQTDFLADYYSNYNGLKRIDIGGLSGEYELLFKYKPLRSKVVNLEKMGDFRKATSNSDDALKYVGRKFEISSNNNERQKLIDNVFSNPQVIGGKKLYGDYKKISDEVTQTVKVMDRINAKSSYFQKAEQGIEGMIYKYNGEVVPVSLKNLRNQLVCNRAIKEIGENYEQIISGVEENKYGGAVRIGTNPNTILDVEIPKIGKQDMINYLKSNPNALNFGPSAYSEISLECQGGQIIKLDKYGKMIN